jgi:hypothetical protein
MKIFDPTTMIGGWYIGNFAPAAYNTIEFEVGILKHKKGEQWPTHYHEHCTEINYLLEGEMTIGDKMLVGPTIFVLEPKEIADPVFITDCMLVVVKTPSIPGDKIVINKENTL